MKDMKQELQRLRGEFDLLQQIPCTPEETQRLRELVCSGQPLPDGVYQQDGTEGDKAEFYRLCAAELTEAEVREYLLLRQCSDLDTIKSCAMFTAALMLIGLALVFFI